MSKYKSWNIQQLLSEQLELNAEIAARIKAIEQMENSFHTYNPKGTDSDFGREYQKEASKGLVKAVQNIIENYRTTKQYAESNNLRTINLNQTLLADLFYELETYNKNYPSLEAQQAAEEYGKQTDRDPSRVSGFLAGVEWQKAQDAEKLEIAVKALEFYSNPHFESQKGYKAKEALEQIKEMKDE